jgi:hypothetical protein
VGNGIGLPCCFRLQWKTIAMRIQESYSLAASWVIFWPSTLTPAISPC